MKASRCLVEWRSLALSGGVPERTVLPRPLRCTVLRAKGTVWIRSVRGK